MEWLQSHTGLSLQVLRVRGGLDCKVHVVIEQQEWEHTPIAAGDTISQHGLCVLGMEAAESTPTHFLNVGAGGQDG